MTKVVKQKKQKNGGICKKFLHNAAQKLMVKGWRKQRCNGNRVGIFGERAECGASDQSTNEKTNTGRRRARAGKTEIGDGQKKR